MIDEMLLGFDCRELWVNPREDWDRSREDWDRSRRERFLLRVDAPKPLSTDTMVWPSVFDTGQGIGLPEAERTRLHLAGLPTPPWIGPNAGLWEDLDNLRRHLARTRAEPRPHALVAVSWFSEEGFPRAGEVGPYPEPTRPPKRDPAWKLLGFDVADGSLVSALSNCGYSQVEARQLRGQWGPHLNSRHLFADLDPAFQFRDLADTRVPEHAPFFVFGLFLIEHDASFLPWLERSADLHVRAESTPGAD